MRRNLTLAAFVFLIVIQFSCKGVKNVSGTLRKSDSGQSRDYSSGSHTDYSKIPVSAAASRESAAQEARVSEIQPRSSSPEAGKTPVGDSYRKDYGRMAAGSSETLQVVSAAGSSSNADINERLVKQYAEMDRLADLVLYELNIVEKRWDQLLGKYKSSSQAEREKISGELDKLSADQLKLYRAHVKIYKEGKSDWSNVKKDVDATLLSIRGIFDK